jgi:beta propeller repeat protein
VPDNRTHSQGVQHIMSRILLVAVLGAVIVVVTLVVTWALWPREQPLGSGGQPVTAGEPAAISEFLVAEPAPSRDQTGGLAFSDDLVVWAEATKDHNGLFAADVRIHQRFPLQRSQGAAHLSSPALSGRLLVWTQSAAGAGDGVELWAARPPRGQPFPLATTTRRVAGNEDGEGGGVTVAPARSRLRGLDVSGDQVVWLERVADKDAPGEVDDRLWLYDAGSRTTVQVKAPAGPKSSVAVDDGLIAWAARDGQTGVWVRDTTTGQTIRVAGSLAGNVDLSGSRLVWCMAGDVYGFDLRTRRRFPVCVAAGVQADVRIAGELIVWRDGRAGGDTGDIYALDLSTGKEVAVCTDKAAQKSPQVSGDNVVWLDDRSGRWQVRGAVVRR